MSPEKCNNTKKPAEKKGSGKKTASEASRQIFAAFRGGKGKNKGWHGTAEKTSETSQKFSTFKQFFTFQTIKKQILKIFKKKVCKILHALACLMRTKEETRPDSGSR